MVWDCNADRIDYEHGGPYNNNWVDNVLSEAKAEPLQTGRLRNTIAAKQMKGLNPPDVEP